MNHWKTRLIAVALVAVALLASGALLGHDEALAAPCCSWCDNGLTNCEDGCGGDPACLDACWARWANCFSHCISSC